MARAAATQTAVTRALKGALAAGLKVAGVRFGNDGTFEIIAGPPKDATDAASPNVPETDGDVVL